MLARTTPGQVSGKRGWDSFKTVSFLAAFFGQATRSALRPALGRTEERFKVVPESAANTKQKQQFGLLGDGNLQVFRLKLGAICWTTSGQVSGRFSPSKGSRSGCVGQVGFWRPGVPRHHTFSRNEWFVYLAAFGGKAKQLFVFENV